MFLQVADEYKAKAESFIASLQEAKSMAEQRAAVAEGKVEVLNASLKKVRRHNLPIQGTTREDRMTGLGFE